MARLPDSEWLVQQVGDKVFVFHEGSEQEIVVFDPSDADATAKAQKVIFDSGLTDEEKTFAHFWCGYFYALAD